MLICCEFPFLDCQYLYKDKYNELVYDTSAPRKEDMPPRKDKKSRVKIDLAAGTLYVQSIGPHAAAYLL